MKWYILPLLLAFIATGCHTAPAPGQDPKTGKCAEPAIYGKVPQEVVNAAKIRCGFIYSRSPCVKYIRHVPRPESENNYHVICRAEEKAK